MSAISSQHKIRGKNHEKKILGLALCVMLFTLGLPAAAQQATKIPRIGFLITSSPEAIAPRMDAFQQGLRELGTWRGKTSSLSGDMQRENSIGYPRSQPS